MPPQIDHAPLDQTTLVDQLNALLSSLNIPITLLSPTDLTPSLLIAILESVLGRRIRHSTTLPGSKVQNMKIFLGVLELDILNADVGLSDVDPRRLAEGERDAVMFVAELLCWMGRRMGYIRNHPHPSDSKGQREVEKSQSQSPMSRLRGGSADADMGSLTPRPPSPSSKTQLDIDAESIFQSGSTVTATGTSSTQRHLFSPFPRTSTDDSITSLNSTTGDPHDDLFQPHPSNTTDYEYPDDTESILSALPPFTRSTSTPPPAPPSCIHEVPSPSILFSRDDFNPSSPPTSPQHARPVRQLHTSTSTSDNNNNNLNANTSFCSECSPTLAQTLPIEHDHPSASHYARNPYHGADLSHSSNTTSNTSTTSVRYTGYIEPVDEDSELASFESNRSMSMLSCIFPSGSGSGSSEKSSRQDHRSVKIEAVKEQFARTQELLNQRALLLSQLAELKRVSKRGQAFGGGGGG